MARKKKQPEPMQAPVFVPMEDETVVASPFGAAVGVAIRTAENHEKKTFRMIITIRAGTQPEKIVFNMGGSYGGPTTQGGGPGEPPECP
jgi:hypothetical protein